MGEVSKKMFENLWQKTWQGGTEFCKFAQLLYNCYTTIALIKNYFLTFSKVNINTIVINELTNVFNKTIPKYLNEKASKEEIAKAADALKTQADAFYKDYDMNLDKDVTTLRLKNAELLAQVKGLSKIVFNFYSINYIKVHSLS